MYILLYCTCMLTIPHECRLMGYAHTMWAVRLLLDCGYCISYRIDLKIHNLVMIGPSIQKKLNVNECSQKILLVERNVNFSWTNSTSVCVCYCYIWNSSVWIKFLCILLGFLSMIIYEVLYTSCLSYNICSAWFLRYKNINLFP